MKNPSWTKKGPGRRHNKLTSKQVKEIQNARK